jgi:hypothetical protein
MQRRGWIGSWPRHPPRRLLQPTLPRLFAAVVIVQGAHVFEHVVQLVQVFLLGVPEDQALGLLGYVLQFQGTEEWLHLAFNAGYLLALLALLRPLRRLTPSRVPAWAFVTFAAGAVGPETWHVVEHAVIISNVVRNNGCPCPGIGDAALGITDVVLHFFYNVVAYAAAVPAFWFVVRGPSAGGQTAVGRHARLRPSSG